MDNFNEIIMKKTQSVVLFDNKFQKNKIKQKLKRMPMFSDFYIYS